MTLDEHLLTMWPDRPLDESRERYAQVQAHMGLMGVRMRNHLCLRCGEPIETYDQVGRCVYGDPCGHRQWQGKIPQ